MNNQELVDENVKLRKGLEAIVGFGDVNLAGEWDSSLRDIIQSMTDCAKRTLRESTSKKISISWWQTELTEHWGKGHVSNDTRRAAKVALDEINRLILFVECIKNQAHSAELKAYEEFRIGRP